MIPRAREREALPDACQAFPWDIVERGAALGFKGLAQFCRSRGKSPLTHQKENPGKPWAFKEFSGGPRRNRTYNRKKRIDTLRPPQKGNAFYWDDELPGFGVRVTASGIKAYVLNYRVKGRERRMTIGRHGEIAPAKARDEAMRLKAEARAGMDPLAERERGRSRWRPERRLSVPHGNGQLSGVQEVLRGNVCHTRNERRPHAFGGARFIRVSQRTFC
ncbi:Arm DNA-binding domain-containing protein [Nitrospinota bacterium]